MVSVLFLATHLAVSFLVWRGIQSHMLKVHPYMAAVVLLMPFWGVLLVLILHFQIFFRADNAIDIDVEKLELESELYRSIPVDDKDISANTVPIEEALVVNTATERRQIILLNTFSFCRRPVTMKIPKWYTMR